ncbi:unnamed protein product [Caenorhabditis bovis]|uniref:Uncharacterized protein n=1 Tax=Caenorhabditis bovis TaxID=2654633 RepID=A0A8S1F0Q5_9PELO|nr:unnamed protein product [Caenorhabditis bovis]
MSDKYSDTRFFFAKLGCCIPVESYAWIIIVLFLCFLFVLLFCLLATATVRWLYKRRMRKRLSVLKEKYTLEQKMKFEFENRLSYLAAKHQINKKNVGIAKKSTEPQPSASGGNSKNIRMTYPTTHTRPRQLFRNQRDSSVDDTPVAMSALPSDTKLAEPKIVERPPSIQRVVTVNQSQEPPPPPHFSAPMAPVPSPPVPTPPPPPPPHAVVAAVSAPPMFTRALAPPSKPTTIATTTATSLEHAHSPSEPIASTPKSSATNEVSPTSSSQYNQAVRDSSESEPPKVDYSSNNIVSPPMESDKVSSRREAAGGARKELKYWMAMSSKTFSTSASSRGWTLDSTGTDRYQKAASTNSSVQVRSHLSQYKTASDSGSDKFRHGAFVFDTSNTS